MAAVLAGRAGQLGKRLEAGLAPRPLVHLHGCLGLLRLHGDGHDLLGQPALVRGLHRQLVAAKGELVEVRARELELLAHLGGLGDHALAGERVGESVVHHGVDRLGVAHPVAEAGVLQQVGRLRHRLHAAGHRHVEVSGADGLVDHPGRADPGGTHLVHGLARDLLRDAGLDLGLAARDLPLTGLQHLPEYHVLNLIRLYLRALEGGCDGGAAEVSGIEGGQAAAELPERGAGGAEDHGLGHWLVSLPGRVRAWNSRTSTLPRAHRLG